MELNARAWLAAVVDSSDDAIVSKTLEGVVTTWNTGAERIFGYSAQEMVGSSILKIIPENRHEEEPMILQRIRRGERVDHFETVRRRKDGTLIDVSVTISPVRDADGKIVLVSKIARDITRAKYIQKELTDAKEAAELARKEAESANQAKDRFLSVLSHELRTPLTPVLAAVSFLEKDLTLPESILENLRMIRRNVETEARLVDDLLDLTRIAQGKLNVHFEVIDAHTLLRNIVAMYQQQVADKSQSIRMSLKATEHQIWADAGGFQQILLNLLSNAVKFTPKNGAISVRTSNDGPNLQIEVSDNGIGMEPGVLPRLFNAFEQGDSTFARRFGGLGLGLSIVKSLMGFHKGSVTAFSAGQNQGSTFTLRLPSVPAAQRPQTPTQETASAKSRSRRILLVEDHLDTQQIMSMLLKSFGCEVSAVGSVAEAAELAQRQSFDLLICDFGLPDGTGVDVMRCLDGQRIKAIAITGFGQDEDLRMSREAGFDIHLTKPVNFDALQRAMQEVGA